MERNPDRATTLSDAAGGRSTSEFQTEQEVTLFIESFSELIQTFTGQPVR
jgi:hypothetical protein